MFYCSVDGTLTTSLQIKRAETLGMTLKVVILDVHFGIRFLRDTLCRYYGEQVVSRKLALAYGPIFPYITHIGHKSFT